MNELYLNNKLIDFSNSTKIALTLSVNDISEIKDRQAFYSNQFRFPKSQRNKEVMESCELIQSGTYLPYTKVDAKYTQNGRELVGAGYAIIDETEKDYVATIYSGNALFFDSIAGKKLSNIDLTDLDHVWNLSNVINSFANTSGYIYPLIDWTKDGAYFSFITGIIDIRTQFPCIYIHTLVSRILSEAGFTGVGDLLSDPDYLSCTMTLISNKPTQESVDQLYVKTRGPANSVIVLPSGSGDRIIPFVNEIEDILNLYSTDKYTVASGGTYDIYAALTYEVVQSIDTVSISVKRYGSTIYEDIITETAESKTGGPLVWDYHVTELIANGIQLEAGDEIVIIHHTTYVNFVVQLKGYSYFEITPKKIATINVGTTWTIGNNLPNWSQAEFLKYIAQIFGIIFQTNTFTKEVEFRQFKDIEKNKSKAKNITNKIADKLPETIFYRFGNYGQNNYLKYKEDQDVADDLGNGNITISDTTLEKDKTLFTVGFSATEMEKSMTNRICPFIKWLELGIPKGTISPRILSIYRASDSLTYTDGVNSQVVAADYPYAYFQLTGKSFQLGFDNSLINDNYSEFERMLFQAKKLVIYLNLDENDIAEQDFFIPWYSEKHNAYFYVNKINNFLSGRSTQCELIRM